MQPRKDKICLLIVARPVRSFSYLSIILSRKHSIQSLPKILWNDDDKSHIKFFTLFSWLL